MIFIRYDGNSYLGQQTENPQLTTVYVSCYCKTGYTDIYFSTDGFLYLMLQILLYKSLLIWYLKHGMDFVSEWNQ